MSNYKQCCKYKFNNAYYCKGLFNFNIERQGECKKLNKIVGANDNCKFWQRANFKPNLSLKMIDKVIADTEKIKHIYEEEN